jgi:hypothetical protein
LVAACSNALAEVLLDKEDGVDVELPESKLDEPAPSAPKILPQAGFFLTRTSES